MRARLQFAVDRIQAVVHRLSPVPRLPDGAPAGPVRPCTKSGEVRDGQRLAVLQRNRGLHGDSSPGHIGIARGAGNRDAHGAVTRGEGGAERTDLDGGCERLVADAPVGIEAIVV